MSLCPECHAAIRWAVVEASGKPMPVDLDPDVEKGNVVYVGRWSGRGSPYVRVLTAEQVATAAAQVADHARRPDLYAAPTTPRFLSHFATCPEAAKRRKKKATRGATG